MLETCYITVLYGYREFILQFLLYLFEPIEALVVHMASSHLSWMLEELEHMSLQRIITINPNMPYSCHDFVCMRVAR